MSYKNNTGSRSFGNRSARSGGASRRGGSYHSSSGQRSNRGGGIRHDIDPRRFVRKASTEQTADYVPQNKFNDFLVHQIIKNNLEAKGYTLPSPIQDQTIPLGLLGKDIIGIANTGTGKTAAFVVPILHKLLSNPRSKALIIAPTRELAQQIEVECRSIGRGSGLTGALLIGGTAMGPQLRDLRSNPPLVIGTPGRIKDHLQRGTLQLQNFETVVLDEVDRMLDMGFINDVRHILSSLNHTRQSFFFSATLDTKVKQLIETFSNEPAVVSVKTNDTSESVNQDVVTYSSSKEKIDKLHNVLIAEGVDKTIVFEETQRGAERLSKELISRGFSADAIHGGKSQGQRQRALSRFRASDISILVATDVAARGIDVVDITHVVNFSIPKTYEDYSHRVGRAGRAGREGNALTFIPA